MILIIKKNIKAIFSLKWFLKDYLELRIQLKKNTDFKISNIFPILNERHSGSGINSGHYFHQDLLIAKKIFEINPKRHIDIGSRTDGFVAHVASFRNIEVLDIRPNQFIHSNIKSVQADLMNLTEYQYECTDSISSLHVIEHFGLGRYGDPIDSEGHIKGLDGIYKMLKKGGIFYFSTPIGPQRIEFNAHRVFSINYLMKYFSKYYILKAFHYVDDNGDLHFDVKLDQNAYHTNFNCQYGCGIFELIKK
jgi:hypothetical protein